MGIIRVWSPDQHQLCHSSDWGAEIMGLSPAWGAHNCMLFWIIDTRFQNCLLYLILLCQDIDNKCMVLILNSDAELLGGFPHSCLSLKVQWLIAARSREEADIGGNGMVVMLFLKKPVERRDEASLSWCWHHLIIRSDVNLRLHSLHTDTHAGIIHTHSLQILQEIISCPKLLQF